MNARGLTTTFEEVLAWASLEHNMMKRDANNDVRPIATDAHSSKAD